MTTKEIVPATISLTKSKDWDGPASRIRLPVLKAFGVTIKELRNCQQAIPSTSYEIVPGEGAILWKDNRTSPPFPMAAVLEFPVCEPTKEKKFWAIAIPAFATILAAIISAIAIITSNQKSPLGPEHAEPQLIERVDNGHFEAVASVGRFIDEAASGDELDVCAINIHLTTHHKTQQMVDAIQRGAHFRFCLIEPRDDLLAGAASHFNPTDPHYPGQLRYETVKCLRELLGLLHDPRIANATGPHNGTLHVKVVDFMPTFRYYGLRGVKAGRQIHIIPYALGHRPSLSPVLYLRTGIVADYYSSSFSQIWKTATDFETRLNEVPRYRELLAKI
jgi:hypothetical protein